MKSIVFGGTMRDISDQDDELIRAAGRRLSEAGIDAGLTEARMLYFSAFPDGSDAALRQGDAFADLVERRAAREPMSHILGHRSFYGREFAVTRDVLDPRPDTETLIAVALEEDFSDLLDLGTGSGAIAVTLLAERDAVRGIATDISEAALDVARGNAAALLDDPSRLGFMRSDWFAGISGEFDLVVSNPPYIAASEMAELQDEVRIYEPLLALTDNGDGLGAYRKIIAQVQSYLRADGRVIVEIGPQQADAVMALMQDAGLREIKLHRDLDGRDRVIAARKGH